jgi:cyclic pyranopterin phosphate synthase
MPILRGQPEQLEPLKQAIVAAMALKPEKHYFDLHEQPQILRFMNATGG